jgi:hypothetical protein
MLLEALGNSLQQAHLHRLSLTYSHMETAGDNSVTDSDFLYCNAADTISGDKAIVAGTFSSSSP